MMRRRDFITLLGGAAAAWPIAARGQQPAMPLIGYFNSGAPEPSAYQVAAFRKGLGEAGFVEGRNVTIEFRWGYNEVDRLPELAADLVRRRVAVIATPGSFLASRAAQAATTTIPIVFSTAANPVQAGLVASLNRPGGNVTGVTTMADEVGGKRLRLLQELVPSAAHFAVLVSRSFFELSYSVDNAIQELQAAGSSIGRQIEVLAAATNTDIDAAFASFVQKRGDALLVYPGPLLNNRRIQIVTLAARHAIPTIYHSREFAEVGGLMSYGSSIADQVRDVGLYTGRILKGEKAADLPVMQATKLELVINLQTAKTLGLAIPASLLVQADEVIE